VVWTQRAIPQQLRSSCPSRTGYSTAEDQFLYDWQTLIAGVLAVVAAVGTIWTTISSANREVEVAQKQIETTLCLERERAAREASAFHAMLEAAMARVLAEADSARKTYAGALAQNTGSSVEALAVRQCFTKGAFAELRAACVQQGGPLTGEFLDLEREIDSFEMVSVVVPRREGKHDVWTNSLP
jgi:hypothetical protein